MRGEGGEGTVRIGTGIIQGFSSDADAPALGTHQYQPFSVEQVERVRKVVYKVVECETIFCGERHPLQATPRRSITGTPTRGPHSSE